MEGAAKFRKKPVVIEAFLYDGENADAIADWMFANGAENLSGAEGPDPHLVITTLEGDHRAEPGDWIIKGVEDEFYPCKPQIFDATYEPA